MSNHRVPPRGWRAHLDTYLGMLRPSPIDWCFFRTCLYAVFSHVLFTSHHNETGNLTAFAIAFAVLAARALMQAHAIMIKTGELR